MSNFGGVCWAIAALLNRNSPVTIRHNPAAVPIRELPGSDIGSSGTRPLCFLRTLRSLRPKRLRARRENERRPPKPRPQILQQPPFKSELRPQNIPFLRAFALNSERKSTRLNSSHVKISY